jgi:hypothetical protein
MFVAFAILFAVIAFVAFFTEHPLGWYAKAVVGPFNLVGCCLFVWIGFKSSDQLIDSVGIPWF